MTERLFGNPVQGRIGAPGHPDPASGYVVTSPFGPRGDGFHDGLDIDNGGPSGDPILAMGSGTVYSRYVDSSGALIIRIDHGGGWTTGYAHMSAFRVALGAVVDEGQKIGDLGQTGYATGPHVHMDTSYQNERLDPWPRLRQNNQEEDWPAMLFRPVKQEWNTKTGNKTPGGQFYTQGPGVGSTKYFTASERITTTMNSGDWYAVQYGDEVLWMHRDNMNPIDGTRDPSSGYGPPTKTPAKAADATRDAAVSAANSEAKKWGAN